MDGLFNRRIEVPAERRLSENERARIFEIASREYEKMYELDDNNEVDKALESARKALELYIKIDDFESVGKVFVFLGDFEKAKIWYEKAFYEKAREKGIDSPCDIKTYGMGYPDLVRLSYRLGYVSRGKNPPYVRTLKRKNRNEIKLVAFDLDGTLTNLTNFWEVLNERFGTINKSRAIADEYYGGKIDYRQWASETIELIVHHGANETNLKEIIRDIQLIPGVSWVLSDLKDRDKVVTLITGSLDILVEHLFGLNYYPDYFDSLIINKLKFNINDGSIKDWEVTEYGDGKYKAKGLREQAREFGLRLPECAYVGDNSNDIEVAKVAGLSIAFNPKTKEFKEVCNVVVEDDMEKIMPYILNRRR